MAEIQFFVNTDPAAYGDAAPDGISEEYARFAEEYLRERGYDDVEVVFYNGFPPPWAEVDEALVEEVWQAFLSA